MWIRHTVHKPPGRAPRGSVWCTVFDAARGAPVHAQAHHRARCACPRGGWIEVGDRGAAMRGAAIGPRAERRCGAARWSLRFDARSSPSCATCPASWLYRAPLPRTKLTSPAPLARFDGVARAARPASRSSCAAGAGMVGHNWGAEHAERWIWLHGCGFDGRARCMAGRRARARADRLAADAVGRQRRALASTASGTASAASSPRGRACPSARTEPSCELAGQRGLTLRVRARGPAGDRRGLALRRPRGGGEHDVVNCSIAASSSPSAGAVPASAVLLSDHGGAYELGMRERDHGVPIAPFGDG